MRERRRHPRYPTHVAMEVEAGAVSHTCSAGRADLSFSGLWAGGLDLPVDTIVRVRLLVRDPIDLIGQIRRTVPGKGCGIEFKYVSPETAQALSDLMRLLESLQSR